MITPRVLRGLSVYLRLTSSYFYAVPFKVTKLGSDFRITPAKDARSIILFCINFSCASEAMIYSFLRLCQMHIMGEYDTIHPYVIHSFNMVGFGYPVFLQLYLMFYNQAFCNYINTALAYDKYLRNDYFTRKSRKMDLLETGISVVVPFVYFQGICFGLYSLMKPKKPFFHCSLLMEIGWSQNAMIPAKVFECYAFINCWHVIVSVWAIFLTASYPLIRWPNELVIVDPRKKASRKSDDAIRKIENSFYIFNHLTMLANRLNEVARVWFCGVSFFAGKFVAIYMGFAAIKLGIEQTLPWTEYMAYPTSVLFIFILSAFVVPEGEKWHTITSKYIWQWQSQRNRFLRRRAWALRPMAVWVMDVIYLTRGKGMEILFDVVNEISDLVISFM